MARQVAVRQIVQRRAAQAASSRGSRRARSTIERHAEAGGRAAARRRRSAGCPADRSKRSCVGRFACIARVRCVRPFPPDPSLPQPADAAALLQRSARAVVGHRASASSRKRFAGPVRPMADTAASSTAECHGGARSATLRRRDASRFPDRRGRRRSVRPPLVWPLIDSMNPSADVLALARSRSTSSGSRSGSDHRELARQAGLHRPSHAEGDRGGARGRRQRRCATRRPTPTRVEKPEWLVVIGICTHLGCVPLGQKPSDPRGEYRRLVLPLPRLAVRHLRAASARARRR